MVCFPNSKINLGLNITEKRSDGYHNIETVFYPVQWHDVLEIVQDRSQKSEIRNEKVEVELEYAASGLSVDSEVKNNLCVKAYQLLKKDFKIPSIKMYLHKVIPMGAGLGGGSSDAAFTLKLLNDFFYLKLSNDNLKYYARQVGSDCAFFIDNIPSFASGTGDQLETINLSLKGLFILIVKPEVHVSAAYAYSMVIPSRAEKSLKEIIELPVTEWKKFLKNDFEKCIFEKYPLIAGLKNKMYEQGAVYASMSGSGSAVYGIFEKKSFDISGFIDCTAFEQML